jgi:uncharacterized lipoprotein YajG
MGIGIKYDNLKKGDKKMSKNKTLGIFYLIVIIISLFLITACAGTPSSPEAVPGMVSAENPVEMV